MIAAASSTFGVVGTVIGAASLLGAAAFAFFGSARKAQIESAKDTIELQGKEIAALKDARLIDSARISRLEKDNELLTEKVTQAAAVNNLIETIQHWRDQDAAEHADLAAMFGRATREH